jgi:hypothetical protein
MPTRLVHTTGEVSSSPDVVETNDCEQPQGAVRT